MKSIIAIIIVVWLVIGAFAAWQRDYFSDDQDVKCKTAAYTTLTVLAGPLNYFGVNPKVNCNDVNVPEPSK